MNQPPRNWMDQHFGGRAGPTKAAPPPTATRSATGIYATFAVLGLLAGAVVCVDYTRLYPLGISEVIGLRSSAAAAPEVEAVFEADPAGVAQVSSGEDPLPRAATLVYTPAEPATDAPDSATPADTTDAAAAAKAARRAKTLDEGIAMMNKQLATYVADRERLLTKFNVRPRSDGAPRRKPWTAAETIDEANWYLKTKGLSQRQVLSAQDAIRNAQAELTNARNRIGELTDLEDGLTKRIERAQGERSGLAVP